MPGTFVWIGRNSPRISAGAFGFISYMSMWLGPPMSSTMMTDFGRGALLGAQPQEVTEHQPTEAKAGRS